MSISRRGTITSYTAPLDIDIVDKYTDVLCAGYDDAIYPNACIDRITLYNIAINFHKMKLLLFLQDANVSDNDKINAVYMHNKQTLSIYARNITVVIFIAFSRSDDAANISFFLSSIFAEMSSFILLSKYRTFSFNIAF